MLAVLLDAASMDDASVGIHGRIAGGVRIRPAEFMDELLLGRGIGRSRRLPGVWRAAAAARIWPDAGWRLVGAGSGDVFANPAIRVDFSGPECDSVLHADAGKKGWNPESCESLAGGRGDCACRPCHYSAAE